jgi:hypothetical protein
MFQALHAAIGVQFEAFEAPRPREVRGCECCTTPTELAALVSQSREQLLATQLDFYARKAMTTAGTVADFRYYWPRLAQLTLQGEFTTDLEIVFGKPLYGQHANWPDVERRALEHLARCMGHSLGAEILPEWDVDGWVCAIGLLAEGVDDPRVTLAPLLSDSPTARANLRAFVADNDELFSVGGKLFNGFWKDAPIAHSTLLSWMRSEPSVRDTARSLGQSVG